MVLLQTLFYCSLSNCSYNNGLLPLCCCGLMASLLKLLCFGPAAQFFSKASSSLSSLKNGVYCSLPCFFLCLSCSTTLLRAFSTLVFSFSFVQAAQPVLGACSRIRKSPPFTAEEFYLLSPLLFFSLCVWRGNQTSSDAVDLVFFLLRP